VQPEGVNDEDSPFDRPGDVCSIPCDGKLPNEDSSQSDWNRQPNEKVPGVPDEDIPFDKPGQLNSIPHNRQPGEEGPDDTPQSWTRLPGDKPAVDDDKDAPFDRPGDVRSIPSGPRRKLPPPRRSSRLAAKKKKATLGFSSFKKTTLGSSFETLTDGRTLRRSARLS
jgi:hypothetical protein